MYTSQASLTILKKPLLLKYHENLVSFCGNIDVLLIYHYEDSVFVSTERKARLPGILQSGTGDAMYLKI